MASLPNLAANQASPVAVTDAAFELAVLTVFQPVAQDQKSQAQRQLDELATRPVALFDTCVLHLEHSQRVEVRFYALQALHGLITSRRYATLDGGRKQMLRGVLLSLGRDGSCVNQTSGSGSSGWASLPLFMRNKLAQVIVAIAAEEYPGTWPTFFADILGALNESRLSIDCFSRIMISIHEDIISLEVPRSAAGAKASMTFKDAMRDGPDGALERVSRAWLEVLKVLLTWSDDERYRLVGLVLNGVERYINWIDIGLVANGGFIGVIFEVLNASEVSGPFGTSADGENVYSDNEALRLAQVAAVGVLSEIVVKKMEAELKLQLIESLGLVPLGARWAETGLPGGMGDEAIESTALSEEDRALGVASAKLLVSLANEILDAWKKVENGVISLQAVGVQLGDDVVREAMGSAQTAVAMMEQLFPAVVRVLRVPEEDVSVIVAPFMLSYVNRMKMMQKRCGELGVVERGQLVRVLEGAAVCARFSRDSTLYAVREGSVEERVMAEEEEQSVSVRRQDVFSLWRNTAKLVSSEAYALVASMLQESCGVAMKAFPSGNVSSWQDAEIALSLFYQLGEGVTEDVLKAGTHPSVELAAAIIQLDEAVGSHRLVALALLEACARYAKVTLFRRDLLPSLASKFFGKAGLGHPSSSVPPRAAYLLCRTVKSLRQTISTISRDILGALMPHLDAIARSPIFSDTGGSSGYSPYARPSGLLAAGASASVSPSGAGVSTPDDRMFAFEAAGLLVGSSDDETVQVEWLQALTRPLMEQLQRADGSDASKGAATSSEQSNRHHIGAHVGALCRQSMEALTRISKGFPVKMCSNRPKLTQALLEPLGPAIQSVKVLGTSKDVRVKFLAYMHRLVECLGPAVVPHLPAVFWALEHPLIDAGDFKDTLVLVNQIVVRFTTNQTVIDSVVIPLFADCSGKVHEFLGSDWDWSMRMATERGDAHGGSGGHHDTVGGVGSTEALREKVELQKQYYSLVNSVSQCATVIDRVLLRDSAAVSDVFQGAVSNVDHGVRKLCIATLAVIVHHWIQTYPDDSAVKEAACVRYGCDVLLFPLLVKPDAGGIDIRDASSISLLSECANQIKALANSSLGEEYLNSLAVQLPAKLGWGEGVVGEVQSQIKTLDGRSLRTYLKSMVVEFHKATVS